MDGCVCMDVDVERFSSVRMWPASPREAPDGLTVHTTMPIHTLLTWARPINL